MKMNLEPFPGSTMFARCVSELLQIAGIVSLVGKTRQTIVAALDDMLLMKMNLEPFPTLGDDEIQAIRTHLQQERVLGSPRFQAMIEKTLNRPVACQPRGRPRRDLPDQLVAPDASNDEFKR